MAFQIRLRIRFLSVFQNRVLGYKRSTDPESYDVDSTG